MAFNLPAPAACMHIYMAPRMPRRMAWHCCLRSDHDDLIVAAAAAGATVVAVDAAPQVPAAEPASSGSCDGKYPYWRKAPSGSPGVKSTPLYSPPYPDSMASPDALP